jgi:hypothetical protein
MHKHEASGCLHTSCGADVYWILHSESCRRNAVSMIEICRIFSDQSGRMVHYWRILCFNTCFPHTAPQHTVSAPPCDEPHRESCSSPVQQRHKGHDSLFGKTRRSIACLTNNTHILTTLFKNCYECEQNAEMYISSWKRSNKRMETII